MSEKIPKAMAEKFAAITPLTDAFCTKHRNEEYRKVIHRLLALWPRSTPRRWYAARKMSVPPLRCTRLAGQLSG